MQLTNVCVSNCALHFSASLLCIETWTEENPLKSSLNPVIKLASKFQLPTFRPGNGQEFLADKIAATVKI